MLWQVVDAHSPNVGARLVIDEGAEVLGGGAVRRHSSRSSAPAAMSAYSEVAAPEQRTVHGAQQLNEGGSVACTSTTLPPVTLGQDHWDFECAYLALCCLGHWDILTTFSQEVATRIVNISARAATAVLVHGDGACEDVGAALVMRVTALMRALQGYHAMPPRWRAWAIHTARRLQNCDLQVHPAAAAGIAQLQRFLGVEWHAVLQDVLS
ncbi:hypothetical protein EON66_08835 [archaeon]|nr:MAG: hypothetical protein EON66_08835 [archaeon]